METQGGQADNRFLWAGLLLPFLLILFVGVSQKIAALSVDPPQYALVYTTDTDGGRYAVSNLNVHVQDGRLAASWKEPDHTYMSNSEKQVERHVRIVRIEPLSFRQEVADLTIPAGLAPDSLTSIPVPEPFASYQVFEGKNAPDGYVAEDPRYDGRGGLFGELFGSHRDYSSIRLVKNGRRIQLTGPEASWHAVNIIGWVKL